MDKYLFQNCQKIIVFSSDNKKVLLCKRKGEADYDGVFSFIGGKMETTDFDLLDGLRREKNEEVGVDFKVKIFPTFNSMMFFRKKDGNSMVLPHYYARYETGDIVLNEEYSEFQWVNIDALDEFEPKISSIPTSVHTIMRLIALMGDDEGILI